MLILSAVLQWTGHIIPNPIMCYNFLTAQLGGPGPIYSGKPSCIHCITCTIHCCSGGDGPITTVQWLHVECIPVEREVTKSQRMGSETLGTLLSKLEWDERDISGTRRCRRKTRKLYVNRWHMARFNHNRNKEIRTQDTRYIRCKVTL